MADKNKPANKSAKKPKPLKSAFQTDLPTVVSPVIQSGDSIIGLRANYPCQYNLLDLFKLKFTGLKLLAADGANSTGGDTQVTLTGTAIGDRVIGIIGHVKANTGAHTFLIPTVGTHFESAISVTNKIVQLQAAGDLSTNTYLFVIAPATA